MDNNDINGFKDKNEIPLLPERVPDSPQSTENAVDRNNQDAEDAKILLGSIEEEYEARKLAGGGLIAGDVIYVNRYLLGKELYKHFAVYIGNNRVIHYAAESGGKFNATIHEAGMNEFLDGSNTFYAYDFSTPCNMSWRYRIKKILGHMFSMHVIPNVLLALATFIIYLIRKHDLKDFHLYTPAETVERAKKRKGEEDYNPLLNNCEDFALWCKTGISESKQVQKFLSLDPTVSQFFVIYEYSVDKDGNIHREGSSVG